jgi:hypothetical protein
MDGIDPDDRVQALLTPVLEPLREGLRALPASARLSIRLGPVEGFARLDGDELVLSDLLDGPEVFHPAEEAALPLDRWRRAAGCVLEAVAARGLALDPSLPAWARVGAAIEAADRASPTLGLAPPDIARAIRTGDLEREPRGGVAVIREWRAKGLGPDRAAVVTPEEWLEVGRVVLGAAAAASLPVPVPRVPEADIPLDLGPWRWAPLRVPAHKRGGVVEIEGSGAVSDAWARAKKPLVTLAASTHGCRLLAGVGGPVGRWAMRSAAGFGQVFGARGIVFVLKGNGGLELLHADAFVGPLSAVEYAETVGTSGTATGTWEVAGPRRLRFDRIDSSGLTFHARDRSMLLPGGGFGIGPMLEALMEDEWSWAAEGDRLVLGGRVFGGPVEIRLQREA